MFEDGWSKTNKDVMKILDWIGELSFVSYMYRRYLLYGELKILKIQHLAGRIKPDFFTLSFNYIL